MVAATVPGTPIAPTTTISGDEEKMVVDFAISTDNGGVSILGYKVLVQN